MEGSSSGVRKGAWTKFEDDLLEACIKQYGEGKWHLVPQRAGLNRCRKSCRLRWINYLRPDIKRGDFSEDEVDLMTRLHKLLGNRWSLIAGRLPGRTSNDVKNFWNTHMRSKVESQKNVKQQDVEYTMKPHEVIKPVPRTFTKVTPYVQGKIIVPNCSPEEVGIGQVGLASSGSTNWWETVLEDKGDNVDNNPCSLLAEGDGTLIMDLWDEEYITSLTTQDCVSWSDFLLDVNLWDNE